MVSEVTRLVIELFGLTKALTDSLTIFMQHAKIVTAAGSAFVASLLPEFASLAVVLPADFF